MAKLAEYAVMTNVVVMRDNDTFHIRIPANVAALDADLIKNIEWCMWRIRFGHLNELEPVCVAEHD